MKNITSEQLYPIYEHLSRLIQNMFLGYIQYPEKYKIQAWKIIYPLSVLFSTENKTVKNIMLNEVWDNMRQFTLDFSETFRGISNDDLRIAQDVLEKIKKIEEVIKNQEKYI